MKDSHKVFRFTITVDPRSVFFFALWKKGISPFNPIPETWKFRSPELGKQLIPLLGLGELEQVMSIEIDIPAMGIATVKTVKRADERLLNLDWSKLAKKDVNHDQETK